MIIKYCFFPLFSLEKKFLNRELPWHTLNVANLGCDLKVLFVMRGMHNLMR